MGIGAERGYGSRAWSSIAGTPELGHLVFAGGITLVARLAVVLFLPELDADAYGHLRLAAAFLDDPTNPRVHWVWLPGWHVALAGALWLGGGHTSVRVANAVLQTLGPWLVYLIARGSSADRRLADRSFAYTAALFYTVAPLPNLMACSAQMETPFSLLLLATAWAVLRERAALAGGLLGLAALVRYEAWGVVALFAVRAVLDRERRRGALIVFAVAASAVGAWLCLRRLGGLPWFSFASATTTFVARYRGSVETPAWLDVGMLVALPVLALGPAVFLAVSGLGALKTRAVEVPGGVFSFLLASAMGSALLPLPRYFTALTPFACIAMAAGAAAWIARSRNPRASRLVPYATISLVALACVHLAAALRRVHF